MTFELSLEDVLSFLSARMAMVAESDLQSPRPPSFSHLCHERKPWNGLTSYLFTQSLSPLWCHLVSIHSSIGLSLDLNPFSAFYCCCGRSRGRCLIDVEGVLWKLNFWSMKTEGVWSARIEVIQWWRLAIIRGTSVIPPKSREDWRFLYKEEELVNLKMKLRETQLVIPSSSDSCSLLL